MSLNDYVDSLAAKTQIALDTKEGHELIWEQFLKNARGVSESALKKARLLLGKDPKKIKELADIARNERNWIKNDNKNIAISGCLRSGFFALAISGTILGIFSKAIFPGASPSGQLGGLTTGLFLAAPLTLAGLFCFDNGCTLIGDIKDIIYNKKHLKLWLENDFEKCIDKALEEVEAEASNNLEEQISEIENQHGNQEQVEQVQKETQQVLQETQIEQAQEAQQDLSETQPEQAQEEVLPAEIAQENEQKEQVKPILKREEMDSKLIEMYKGGKLPFETLINLCQDNPVTKDEVWKIEQDKIITEFKKETKNQGGKITKEQAEEYKNKIIEMYDKIYPTR